VRLEPYVARMGETRKAYKIFVLKPDRRRPLGRPSCSWEYIIRTNLREIGWIGVDWMHASESGQGLKVGSFEHGNESSFS
jgi:hypothetical protein